MFGKQDDDDDSGSDPELTSPSESKQSESNSLRKSDNIEESPTRETEVEKIGDTNGDKKPGE